MRDLEETEIEYLRNHTVEDFLYDVLQFDDSDIKTLKGIKKLISDWCTRPAHYEFSVFNSPEDFFTQTDKEDSENVDEFDIRLFQDEEVYINAKETLTSIINALEELKVPKENYNSDYVTVKTSAKLDPMQFEKTEGFGLDSYEDLPTDGLPSEGFFLDKMAAQEIMKALPESTKKWMEGLEMDDLFEAADKAADILAEDFIEHHDIETEDPEVDMDSLISEIVDQIKDIAILKYVERLKFGETITFKDDEILSEVLDYLYDGQYKVKAINNKVSLI